MGDWDSPVGGATAYFVAQLTALLVPINFWHPETTKRERLPVAYLYRDVPKSMYTWKAYILLSLVLWYLKKVVNKISTAGHIFLLLCMHSNYPLFSHR